MLSAALANGMTPFLDLILSYPHATLEDVGQTLREAYRWLRAGCEIGMYPYVIPFSGSAFAQDRTLLPQTYYAHQRVAGTDIAWQQPVKILPIDPVVTNAILRMESSFEAMLGEIEEHTAHLPSRLRSLLWILSSLPIMAERGQFIADESEVWSELHARLPSLRPAARMAAATA
jgi:hypothetical protein